MHNYNSEFDLVWAYENPYIASEKVREDFLKHKGKADYHFYMDGSKMVLEVRRHLRTITMPENDFWEFEMQQAIHMLDHIARREIKKRYKNDDLMLLAMTKNRYENLARMVA